MSKTKTKRNGNSVLIRDYFKYILTVKLTLNRPHCRGNAKYNLTVAVALNSL